MGIVPNIKYNNKNNMKYINMKYMMIKTVPARRRCRWVQSSGPERAPQGEQDSLNPSGLSKATGPVPTISHHTKKSILLL